MQAEEITKLLEDIPLLIEATQSQRAQVSDLLLHPGLSVLIGLILAERQGMLVQLAHARAGSQAEIQKLGELQGRIIGIDRIRQVLLECVTVPTDTKE